jgi:hypothetical protein
MAGLDLWRAEEILKTVFTTSGAELSLGLAD